jgi:hypothetical protein
MASGKADALYPGSIAVANIKTSELANAAFLAANYELSTGTGLARGLMVQVAKRGLMQI